MYTDLEKVLVNFPDICFEKRFYGLGGYSATIPGVYETIFQEASDVITDRANACLTNIGLRKRASWFIEPLVVSGRNQDVCATKILEAIRNNDIHRRLINDSIKVSPQSNVGYFPVYENDPFHKHGDPDFIDLAQITCEVENSYGHVHETLDRVLSFIFNCLDDDLPSVVFGRDGEMIAEMLNFRECADEDQEEVVLFKLDYGNSHCHMISAETLAAKLEPKF